MVRVKIIITWNMVYKSRGNSRLTFDVFESGIYILEYVIILPLQYVWNHSLFWGVWYRENGDIYGPNPVLILYWQSTQCQSRLLYVLDTHCTLLLLYDKSNYIFLDCSDVFYCSVNNLSGKNNWLYKLIYGYRLSPPPNTCILSVIHCQNAQ